MEILGKKYLYKDEIGFVEVYKYDYLSGDDIKTIISDISSLSVGNDKSKDPEKLFDLLKELGHESPFEFIRFYSKKDGETNLRRSDIKDIDVEKTRELIKDYLLVKIKVPLFVSKQIMRHRVFSYLEVSRRYVKPNKKKFEFYYRDRNILDRIYEYIIRGMYYIGLKFRGYKPEVSRGYLSQNLYTEFYMLGNSLDWLNFFIERYHKNVQPETREVVNKILDILIEKNGGYIGRVIERFEDYINLVSGEFRKSRVERYNKFLKYLNKKNQEE